jgi:hypothetical protein
MNTPSHTLAAKISYALLFTVLVPLFLGLWAHLTATRVDLPVTIPSGLGYFAAALGMGFMLTAMAALWLNGRGLPMNLCPPPNYVAVSIYRYLPHPIYLGFCLTVAGVSVVMQSSSGLWLVSPVATLACVAIVYGYENNDLDKRFGSDRFKPLIKLPDEVEQRPGRWDRVSVFLLVLIPWLVVYELAVLIGPPNGSWSVALPLERDWPVIEWTEVFYASVYLWVVLAPLVARSRRALREFAVSALWLTALGAIAFFLLPIVTPTRPFTPHSALGSVLLWERAHDTSAAAFPAFHLIWAMLAAKLFSTSIPRLRFLWYALAGAIGVSCLTTGAHAAADLLAAILAIVIVWNRNRIWTAVLGVTERLSNSWQQWRIGPVRIINHGVYAGLGAFVGTTVVAVLLPDIGALPLLIMNAGGLLGGALLAQALEGSSKLLRPFGYFGSVLGTIMALAILSATPSLNGWFLCAAFAVAAPLIQAFGRLRCLVQGCCHGRKAVPPSRGIRYRHLSSRVTHLAGIADLPIYPTPLYSIVWNFVIFLLLARLWTIGVSAAIIAGLYFILIGVGRFVEESYRGEPQTPMVGRLRIYQWFSVGFVVGGAILSCLPAPGVPGTVDWNWSLIPAALLCGLAAWAAMGVDFPESNRRFARLSG